MKRVPGHCPHCGNHTGDVRIYEGSGTTQTSEPASMACLKCLRAKHFPDAPDYDALDRLKAERKAGVAA